MVAAAAMASSAQAATLFKFAEFCQVPASPGANVIWNNPGNATTSGTLLSSPLAAPIQFSFLDPALSGIHNVQATFWLNSGVSNVPAVSVGGTVDQAGLAGSFQIVYTGAADLIVGLTHYHTGANLLSGVFNNGDIAGKGSVGATLVTTVSGSVLNFTSDFKSFGHSVQRDFVLNLNAISPVLGANAGKALKSFTANADGAFASAVPEPSTWAVMIVGFGMIGLASRRRRAIA